MKDKKAHVIRVYDDELYLKLKIIKHRNKFKTIEQAIAYLATRS